MCRQTIYDVSDEKNRNVSFEGFDIHYRTRCNASENVCLDLQNCHYSVFIGQWNNHLHFMNCILCPTHVFINKPFPYTIFPLVLQWLVCNYNIVFYQLWFKYHRKRLAHSYLVYNINVDNFI